MSQGAAGGSAWRVSWYGAVGSTNDIVREQAEAGAPAGLVVVAESQHSGRGRQGRRWDSPKGNLYCSMLLRPEAEAETVAGLSLVIGAVLAETLEAILGAGAGIAVKWPNDVLLGDAKLAGILLERAFDDAGRPFVIAGMGVNLAHHPKDAPYPVTSLSAAGADLTPAELLLPFLERLEPALALFATDGFGALRQRWLDRAHGIGAPVRLRLGDGTRHGRFVDIDEDGALLMTDDANNDRCRYTAGELFFAASGTSP